MVDGAGGRVISGALLLLYPVAVFIGLRHLDPRWLAALLVVAAGWRLAGARSSRQARAGLTALAIAALCATAITFATGSPHGLLLYPVMVNGVLLAVFATSLARPPSAIETLARLREPDLPPEAILYTRRVTQLWTLFFTVNGAIALATVFVDRHWWVLYNGLIAYLLMGALLAGEWLVRRRVREGTHG